MTKLDSEALMSQPVTRTAAILEADKHFATILTNYCKDEELDAKVFTNPSALVEAMDQESFDLFLIDWNTKGDITGAGVVNRIRTHLNYGLVPTIVFSGTLEEDDISLTKEFFSTEFTSKPFSQGIFKDYFKKVLSEQKWYKKSYQAISQALKIEETDTVCSQAIINLMKQTPNPVPLGRLISDLLMEKEMWDAAEPIQREILKYDKHNIKALCNLGKISMAKNDPKLAYQHLKQADTISPHNIDRICNLGHLELESYNPSKASETFSRGLSLDQRSKTAAAGKVVSENLEEYLKDRAPTISQSLACLMNCIGINKVREGAINDGITHYMSALSFIHDSMDKTKVMFNIGYGYYRQSDFETALEWFNKSSKESQNKFEKAVSYAKLLEEKAFETLNYVDDLDDVHFCDSELLDVT